MKLYASDFTHTFIAPIRELVSPETDGSVTARELRLDELLVLAADPQYDLSEKAARNVQSEGKHCFGTFNEGTLSAYIFLASGVIEPEYNTAGVGFGGIGFRLPPNVLYAYKLFSLAEFRGQNQVGVAIAEGAKTLIESGGWIISTTDTGNKSAIRMFEKLGFKQRAELREYRILGLGKYKMPDAVQLGEPGDDDYKRVELFTPNTQ